MKAIITALAIPVLLSAQRPVEASAFRVDLKELRSGRSCYTDAETYSQEFIYQAIYTNRSRESLTIRLGSEVPIGVFVAKTLGDLNRKRLEEEQRGDVFPDENGQLIGSKIDERRIVEIRPRASATSRGTTQILVRRIPRELPGTINPGSYILQLQIILETSETGSKSRSPGFHWVSVFSEPTQIEVPSSPQKLEDCTEPR